MFVFMHSMCNCHDIIIQGTMHILYFEGYLQKLWALVDLDRVLRFWPTLPFEFFKVDGGCSKKKISPSAVVDAYVFAIFKATVYKVEEFL